MELYFIIMSCPIATTREFNVDYIGYVIGSGQCSKSQTRWMLEPEFVIDTTKLNSSCFFFILQYAHHFIRLKQTATWKCKGYSLDRTPNILWLIKRQGF